MRLSRLALLLTGCTLTALASPAWSQEAQVADPSAETPVEAEVAALLPPPIAIPAEWAPVPSDGLGRSAYGLYLSGRLALFRGDNAIGSDLLAQSQALTPEQPVLGEEAFRSGLFAGDLQTLAELAVAVQDEPRLAEPGRLIMVVDALNRGDARTGLTMLRSQPFVAPFDTISQYIQPALAAAAGDWDAALAPVEAPPTALAALVLRHQRARLLDIRRRYAEAEAEYQLLTGSPLGARLFLADHGAFLERRGRRDEALAIYAASLSGSSPDPEALTGRIRVIERAPPPPTPTIQESAAFAVRLAAIQAGEQGERELSALFLRLSEGLNADDETALRLGLSLVAPGMRQEELARQAFSRVSRANPILYSEAQFGIGQSLQRDESDEEALAAFQRADAAAPGQDKVILRLAQQLSALDRHEEALAVLNRPVVNVADQSPVLRFMRGATLERLGRLDDAENELWAALTAAPNEPLILNQLGYMWVDTGRRVEQGAEMLARAHAADPENGAIQYSLGWAQFRQGQYEVAVETLEGAVNKQPGNPEIVDHLGDAYWQVGRRREAEWQWSRVLTLEPDAERRAGAERKLAQGLTAPSPVSASAP